MIRITAVVALIAPLFLLAACQSAPTGKADAARTGPAISPASSLGSVTRSQGYALLYSTLADDSQVDKSMMLKSPAAPVAAVIKDIAQFCTQAKEQIEAYAKADRTIGLKTTGLPDAELKTRDAISGTTTKQILFNGGKEFEFRILLTQHEALNYITHMAGVMAKLEPDPQRQAFLAELTKSSAALHERVMTLMKGPYVGAGK